MKRLALLCLLAFLFFTVFAYADQLYFYGGDSDPNDPNFGALSNEDDAVVGGNPYGSAVYQNFYALSNITVSGLFTNNFSSYVPTSGYWEIRSGVSEGTGGTLIASGSGPVTNDPTGRHFQELYEFTNLVSGLNVSLAAGQYWFAVVPECPTCQGRAFNGNTFGLNSVGTSDLDLEYINTPGFANFMNLGSDFPTGSSGVYVNNVPEPGSFLLLGTGVLGGLGVLRRKLWNDKG